MEHDIKQNGLLSKLLCGADHKSDFQVVSTFRSSAFIATSIFEQFCIVLFWKSLPDVLSFASTLDESKKGELGLSFNTSLKDSS